MGNIRKIGREYYIEFIARGLKYQLKAGPGKSAAQKALKDIEAKIAAGEENIIARDVETEVFWEDYLRFAEVFHTPRSASRFRKVIGHFRCFLEKEGLKDARLSSLTPRVIEKYKTDLVGHWKASGRPNPDVVNFTLYLLRDIFEFALKKGCLNDNPLCHIRPVPSPAGRHAMTLSEEDLSAVLANVSGILEEAVRTILETGMTLKEIIRLEWDDVDREGRTIRVRGKDGKEEWPPERQLNMASTVEDILKRRENGSHSRRVFCSPSGAALDEAEMRAALASLGGTIRLRRRLGFSVFRRLFARRMFAKTTSLTLLYKIMGYGDIARAMMLIAPWTSRDPAEEDYFSVG